MDNKKTFYVIAYDISSSKRRKLISQEVIKNGGRVNLSVYECLLTKPQYVKLMKAIDSIVDPKTDKILVYRICLKCFQNRCYYPDVESLMPDVTRVV